MGIIKEDLTSFCLWVLLLQHTQKVKYSQRENINDNSCLNQNEGKLEGRESTTIRYMNTGVKLQLDMLKDTGKLGTWQIGRKYQSQKLDDA